MEGTIMKRWPLLLILTMFVLAGCRVVRLGVSTPEAGAPTNAAATATPLPPSLPAQGAPESSVILQSASLSLIAEDPVLASASLEQLIQEAGGYVVSASSWSSPEGGGYASLSARVPPQALAGLRLAVIDTAVQTQSDSRYSQDVTVEYGFLLAHAAELEQADLDLQRFLSETRDPVVITSCVVLQGLLLQERKNVESQLQNYRDRMNLASLDVSWTQNVSSLQLLATPDQPDLFVPR
jgi:hypothetical protein